MVKYVVSAYKLATINVKRNVTNQGHARLFVSRLAICLGYIVTTDVLNLVTNLRNAQIFHAQHWSKLPVLVVG